MEIIQIYYRQQADRRPSPTWPQPGSLPQQPIRQVRLGKGKESKKGCWSLDENRGSSAALASSQSPFLPGGVEGCLPGTQGIHAQRVVCTYDQTLEWNQLCTWKPCKGRSLDAAPSLCGGEPPSPAGARRKSEQHFYVGTGQTNMRNKSQARKRRALWSNQLQLPLPRKAG